MFQTLYSYSREGVTTVLLRHSVREVITDARLSKDVPLTDEGRKLAIEFGSQLPKDRFLRLFHSPSPRCRETAGLICNGFMNNGGEGVIDGEYAFLGSPFMLKPQRALGIVNELGGLGFVREWFNGNIDESIVEPPNQAINNMINSIINLVKSDRTDEIHILVTHDFTITLMIGLLLDLARQDFKWPGYLEGLLIKFDGENITVFYDGVEKTYKITDFEGKGYGFQMA